jgi:hypothetical protein
MSEETAVSRREARLLVATYYAIQELRVKLGGRRSVKVAGISQIKFSGRLGSLMKEVGFTEEHAEMLHSGITAPIKKAEEFAKKRIAEWVGEQPLYDRWLTKVPGIGPILAGNLLALMDIERASTVSKLWSYLGQDVRKYAVTEKGGRKSYRQWFANEQERQAWIARQVENQKTFYEAMKAAGKVKGKIDLKKEEEAYLAGTCTGEGDFEIIGSAPRRVRGMKINWSPIGRKTCWLVGESFVKQKAEDCLYRKIYDDAKSMYMARLTGEAKAEELDGLDAEEAAAAQDLSAPDEEESGAAEGTEGPEGEAKPEEPKGLKAIAHRRAKRKAVKIFLSHLWEVARRLKGLPIRRAYVIEKLGHGTVIEPPFAEDVPPPVMLTEEEAA